MTRTMTKSLYCIRCGKVAMPNKPGDETALCPDCYRNIPRPSDGTPLLIDLPEEEQKAYVDKVLNTPPSKQSEECYVDSRTPEEKANEPSATVTSAGGPMTVALTPPKAEGQYTIEALDGEMVKITHKDTKVTFQLKRSEIIHIFLAIPNPFTPKADWVGEFFERLQGMVTDYSNFPSKANWQNIENLVREALTSATRAAEERKDGEIRGIVDAAHKLSKVLWDTMPFFTKEVGDADLELRRLLPPPPDKPTQP